MITFSDIEKIPNITLRTDINWFPTDNETIESLINILNNKENINNILDLGSGASTRILSYYKTNINNNCEIYSVENNIDYLNKLNDIDNVNKLQFDAFYSIDETYYENLNKYLIDKNIKFDLVIVDGPYSFNTKLARTNILELIDNNIITDNTTIIIHDTDRIGEKNLIAKILEKLNVKHIKFNEISTILN